MSATVRPDGTVTVVIGADAYELVRAVLVNALWAAQRSVADAERVGAVSLAVAHQDDVRGLSDALAATEVAVIDLA